MRILKNEYAVPDSTGAAAVFPFTEDLARQWTTNSRYEDVITLYKTQGKGADRKILLPRNAFNLGKVDNRVEGLPIKFETDFVPRGEEQERFIAEARKLLLGGKSFLAEAPTGSGKTVMSTQIIANVGRKTAVIVTKEDIAQQWALAFKKFLKLPDKDIGWVQGDTCQIIDKKVVIMMVQSLSKEGKYTPAMFNDIGLLIVDEVHRIAAEHFSNAIWLFNAKLRIGLSATPTRKDGREVVFNTHIGNVMVKMTQMKLLPRVLIRTSQWKVPLVYWGGKMQPLPHTAGKTMHVNKYLAKDPKRNAEIAKFVKAAYDKDRRIIVMSDIRDHLEVLTGLLIGVGVKTADIAYYWGGIKKEERAMAAKRKVLLATYGFTSEGTDLPRFDTLVMATPRSDVVQIAGRVLREHPDKKEPLIFDIVDSASRVLQAYAGKRQQWYRKIGAKVEVLA